MQAVPPPRARARSCRARGAGLHAGVGRASAQLPRDCPSPECRALSQWRRGPGPDRDAGQRDESHPIRKLVDDAGRSLHRQTALADAAWPEQRYQTRLRERAAHGIDARSRPTKLRTGVGRTPAGACVRSGVARGSTRPDSSAAASSAWRSASDKPRASARRRTVAGEGMPARSSLEIGDAPRAQPRAVG